MPKNLPPIPFPSTPAAEWLMRKTAILERFASERSAETRRYRSEAEYARSGECGQAETDQGGEL